MVQRGSRRPLVVILAASVLVPCSARAQTAVDSAPTLRIGARARAWERVATDLAVPVTGIVSRIGTDSLVLRAGGVRRPVGVPRAAILRVEAGAGPHSGSRGAAAWRGAVVGLVSGAVLGVIGGDMARRNAPRWGLAGAGLGAGAGAVVGAMVPGEAWRPASLPVAAVAER